MGPTPEIHILVIFSCRTGEVEQLALAAAVGAVQARALIRLRRVTDPDDSPDDRLSRDYVAPRAGDTAWADGFVMAVSGHHLSHVHALGGYEGKPEVWLQDRTVLSDSQGGYVDRDGARLLGRQVAETARTRKGSTQ
jgi:hypothetical protein